MTNAGPTAPASLTLPGDCVAATSVDRRLWIPQAGGSGPTIDGLDS